jgi:surface polysaccharide O-acyltransferase-like enzyme
MITGAIFLNPQKELALKDLLLKYELRLVLALFIFGAVFSLLEIVFNAKFTFQLSFLPLAAVNVLRGDTWDVLWYLYMITGLYLLLPIFKIFVKFSGKKILEYALIVLFIFTSVVPAIKAMTNFELWGGRRVFAGNSVYIFYLLFGYYIHTYKIHVRKTAALLVICFFVCLCIIISITYHLYPQNTAAKFARIAGYNSPVMPLVSASIFILLYRNNAPWAFFNFISPLCFGIYLLHMFFINLFYKFFHFTPLNYPFWLVGTVVFVFAFLCSAVLIYFMRKIKVIRPYLL